VSVLQNGCSLSCWGMVCDVGAWQTWPSVRLLKHDMEKISQYAESFKDELLAWSDGCSVAFLPY
jgi:hypothetical protein